MADLNHEIPANTESEFFDPPIAPDTERVISDSNIDTISQIIPDAPERPIPSRTRWFAAGVGITALLACLIAAGIVAAVFRPNQPHEEPVRPPAVATRLDCYPDLKQQEPQPDDVKKESECLSRGCLWDAKGTDNNPCCYYPDDWQNYEPYLASDLGSYSYRIEVKNNNQTNGFKDNIEYVSVKVFGVDDNTIRIRITDRDGLRWEPPLYSFDPETKSHKTVTPNYNFTYSKTHVSIRRNDSDIVIFETDLRKLIFSEHFIQLTTEVASKSFYGFGQRMSPHLKTLDGKEPNERDTYLFFNFGAVDGASSSYGSHPFYLMYDDNNHAHGVLLVNSNPMDVVHSPIPSMTYRTIGGMLDFFIFMGPDAMSVMRQKANIIGLPFMPPYWSLGFHLSRYGYKDASDMIDTFYNNTMAGVPVDVQWADIEYQDDYNLFTIGQKFKGMPEFIRDIRKTGRTFVPIMNPSVSFDESKPGFKSGRDMGVFIMSENQILRTSMRQPLSAVIDFTSPNAYDWFLAELHAFAQQVPIDGIWLNMNEPQTTNYHGRFDGCPNVTYDRPPYNPAYDKNNRQYLEYQTVCMSANHSASVHYNVHNAYSLYHGKVVYDALINLTYPNRPFVISQSAFIGSGSFVGLWTGEITSSWHHMKMSIPAILDSNLFGIPMAGSDICGFDRETTAELCARWSSLGAFYTFSRNHNQIHMPKQDPASLGGDVLVAARKALDLRYSLLPYLYPLFFNASISGEPVIRSLKFNFPHDPNVTRIDEQFMWGDKILISPVLQENMTEITAYFPEGRWYNITDCSLIHSGHGDYRKLLIPITDISVALRGGSILPMIASSNMTTSQQQDQPINLIVALDEDGAASGMLFWDDGITHEIGDKFSIIDFNVNVQTTVFQSSPRVVGYTVKSWVKEIRVTGIRFPIAFVYLESKTMKKVQLKGEEIRQRTGRLVIDLTNYRPDASLEKEFQVTWTYDKTDIRHRRHTF